MNADFRRNAHGSHAVLQLKGFKADVTVTAVDFTDLALEWPSAADD